MNELTKAILFPDVKRITELLCCNLKEKNHG